MAKYKYGIVGSRHKHEWGAEIGHDRTQFCKLCKKWRALRS